MIDDEARFFYRNVYYDCAAAPCGRVAVRIFMLTICGYNLTY